MNVFKSCVTPSASLLKTSLLFLHIAALNILYHLKIRLTIDIKAALLCDTIIADVVAPEKREKRCKNSL